MQGYGDACIVVLPDPLRRAQQRVTPLQLAPPAASLAWFDGVRRSKIRRPEAPARALRRPRLLAQIDAGQAPLTLIVAPAGFGKSTIAAEWASQGRPAIWLTADAADASLARFWAHLRAGLGGVAPGLGELVTASLELPHRAAAAELGRIFADELLDHGEPLRMVIDDAHLIPAGEVHDFLNGLLELAPPSLRLLVTARIEPPIALSRFRLRGQVQDIGSAELLFDSDEIRAFLANVSGAGRPVTAAEIETMRRQTGGWAAGLRLVSLRRTADERQARHSAAPPTLDHQLLGPLLSETMASFSPQARRTLLRAAIPESFTATLVHELGGGETPYSMVGEVLQFASSSGICRPAARDGGDWLEFHPLFRDLLLQQLAQTESPQHVAALHTCAATWFAANGMVDEAISHHLAAGDLAAAVALVEQQAQPALAREELPSIARWLALLPPEVVAENPRLLLAWGWVLHFRGLNRQLADLLASIANLLARGGLSAADATLLRTEAALMDYGTLLPFQIDAGEALSATQRAAAQLTPAQVFAAGLAHAGIGVALHANGRTREGVGYLENMVARAPAPIDAAAIRLWLALLWIHTQASHLSEVAAVAQAAHELASRHDLRLSAGWASRFLGDACYEQNDLDGAIAHYTAIVQDHEYFHLAGVREALFGLALTYRAQGRLDEARRALQRVREIMLAAGALEHLPLLEAYAAYLALSMGEPDRALAWARSHAPEVDSAPLFLSLHPAMIQAAIFSAAGDDADLTAALEALHVLQERCERGHYDATLIRVDALLAVTHMKRGDVAPAVAAMRRALASGVPRGFVRIYLDLLPIFPAEMRALAALTRFPPAVEAAMPDVAMPGSPPALPTSALEMLTEREGEVLAALAERQTYKEIAASLYISPATVKRHVSNVYSKLGVSGRREAVRAAQELS